jgi:hypothetical protein
VRLEELDNLLIKHKYYHILTILIWNLNFTINLLLASLWWKGRHILLDPPVISYLESCLPVMVEKTINTRRHIPEDVTVTPMTTSNLIVGISSESNTKPKCLRR